MPTRKLLFGILAITFATLFVTRTRNVNAQSGAFTLTYLEFDGRTTDKITLARLNDGSKVRSNFRTAPDGNQYNQRMIWDVAEGARIVVDALTQSITTYPIRNQQIADLQRPASRCDAGLMQRNQPFWVSGRC